MTPPSDSGFRPELDPDAAADEIVAMVRRRYPELLHRAGARAAALDVATAVLNGVAGRRMPGAAELARHRTHSRRAAEIGVTVEATTDATLLSLRHAWEQMALAGGPGFDLSGLIDLIWAWTEAYAVAVSDGFADYGKGRHVYGDDLIRPFLGRLNAGQAENEGSRVLARALGFDPEGDFQALYVSSPRPRDGAAATMNRWMRAGGEAVALVVSGGATLVAFQNVPAERVLTLLGVERSVIAGIGLVRPGLAGARDSIGDAEQALRLATLRQRSVWFEREWFPATLLPLLDRLRPLLEHSAGGEQQHLESAVQAYARSMFSITQSAHDLSIHPNTLKYRLDRWQALTGWDPRTLDGLQRSLLAGLLRRP